MTNQERNREALIDHIAEQDRIIRRRNEQIAAQVEIIEEVRRDLDDYQAMHSQQIETIARLQENPRPLTADDITDEARERAYRAVAALSVSDWDDMSGVAKGRAMALVEAVIIEITRPLHPSRPEGAEDLETVIGLNAGQWTNGAEDVRELADLLASKGVRVGGEERS